MSTLSDLMHYYHFRRENQYQINLHPYQGGEHHIALRFSTDPDGVGLEAFRCTVYLHDQLYTKTAAFNMTGRDIENHTVWAWLKNRYEVRDEKMKELFFINNSDRSWPWWFNLGENGVSLDIYNRVPTYPSEKLGSIIFTTDAPLADDLDLSYTVQFTEDGLQYGKHKWELDNFDSVNIARIKDIIERRLYGLPLFADTFADLCSAKTIGSEL